MKKFILLFIFLFQTISFSQYTPTSLYLQNPELVIGYTDSCANFWLQTWDNSIGGFYTNIDKFGNVINSPAPRALDYFPVIIESGKVLVDLSKKIQRRGFDKKQITYAI